VHWSKFYGLISTEPVSGHHDQAFRCRAGTVHVSPRNASLTQILPLKPRISSLFVSDGSSEVIPVINVVMMTIHTSTVAYTSVNDDDDET